MRGVSLSRSRRVSLSVQTPLDPWFHPDSWSPFLSGWKMRIRLALLLSFAAVVTEPAREAVSQTVSKEGHQDTPHNILFIAVDDLRPQMGCYGETWMHTPVMDRLAGEGIRFDHHYVNYAVCIPSRTALLTSLCSVSSR